MNKDDAIKEARKKYYKQWRAKNKERIKLINERYWLNRLKKELNKED